MSFLLRRSRYSSETMSTHFWAAFCSWLVAIGNDGIKRNNTSWLVILEGLPTYTRLNCYFWWVAAHVERRSGGGNNLNFFLDYFSKSKKYFRRCHDTFATLKWEIAAVSCVNHCLNCLLIFKTTSSWSRSGERRVPVNLDDDVAVFCHNKLQKVFSSFCCCIRQRF